MTQNKYNKKIKSVIAFMSDKTVIINITLNLGG